MRPTDLDDLTPVEPDDATLARVQARSVSFHRRRNYQRSAGAVTGMLVVVLAVGIALTRVDAGSDRVTTTIPTATTTTIAPAPATTPVTVDALVGTWLPRSIAGYTGPLLGDIGFGDTGSWNGNDGCNDFSGTYQLADNGAIQLNGQQTQVGCPNQAPLPTAATRVELVDGRLRFFAADGGQLAQYERMKISATFELAAQTTKAGSTLTGRVIVANDTGQAVRGTKCGGYFQVVLTNSHAAQQPAWDECAQRFTFPVGESTYPVTITATYLACTSGPAQGSIPACLQNNAPPPLPPGDYQAKLFQSGDIVSIPAPITLRITPAFSSH